MNQHTQSITVRNERGREMLDLVRDRMYLEPGVASGDPSGVVLSTLQADDAAKFGLGPKEPMPRWLGDVIASLLTAIGPKGLNFGKYSVEYHYLRNYLYVNRYWGERAMEHIPSYVREIVKKYDSNGEITKMLKKGTPINGRPSVWGPQKKEG